MRIELYCMPGREKLGARFLDEEGEPLVLQVRDGDGRATVTDDRGRRLPVTASVARSVEGAWNEKVLRIDADLQAVEVRLDLHPVEEEADGDRDG